MNKVVATRSHHQNPAGGKLLREGRTVSDDGQRRRASSSIMVGVNRPTIWSMIRKVVSPIKPPQLTHEGGLGFSESRLCDARGASEPRRNRTIPLSGDKPELF